ncbi:MAG: HEPN domain-containing protein [Acidobacteriota bacterium]|nr:HEPN domain-containing protein [Acidobacteriota bacterium]
MNEAGEHAAPLVAVLLHGFAWAGEAPEAPIAAGITLCRMSGTPVEFWYHKLCAEQGVDDGDPFQYEAFLLLKPRHDDYYLNFGDPLSRVDRLLNLVTVITGGLVGMSRILVLEDGFRSVRETHVVFALFGQTEFLQGKWPALTGTVCGEIAAAWKLTEELWESEKSRGRIANALLFFYTAWRSHYIEHICLNLAVCLEILFAPNSQFETAHQIAFNISRFVSDRPAERQSAFRQVKRFYAVRSAIVHGGIPSDGKVIDATVEMFPVTVTILRKLLLDREWALRFSSDEERRKLFDGYLFGA